jgi:hypothetical protein
MLYLHTDGGFTMRELLEFDLPTIRAGMRITKDCEQTSLSDQGKMRKEEEDEEKRKQPRMVLAMDPAIHAPLAL